MTLYLLRYQALQVVQGFQLHQFLPVTTQRKCGFMCENVDYHTHGKQSSQCYQLINLCAGCQLRFGLYLLLWCQTHKCFHASHSSKNDSFLHEQKVKQSKAEKCFDNHLDMFRVLPSHQHLPLHQFHLEDLVHPVGESERGQSEIIHRKLCWKMVWFLTKL